MHGPLEVEPEALHRSGNDLETAAKEASRRLTTSRDAAGQARPGFPGDAAAPFGRMLDALAADDTAIVDAVERTGGSVTQAGSSYDSTDGSNAGGFRGIRITPK